MEKKYLAKIIASDNEGLQMISACSAGAKVKVSDIKYLASNKVFLLSIERTKVETDQEDKKINSICRFDFVDKVKSKNIDQDNEDLVLELIAIDYLKNNDEYEINLIESNKQEILPIEEPEILENENKENVKVEFPDFESFINKIVETVIIKRKKKLWRK